MIACWTAWRDADGEPPSVLLVDDDPSVRRGLTSVLESEGMVVTTASSLPEAARLLGRGRFDLVITDLRLAEAGGRQGLEVVSRARHALPHAAIVLFTAFGDEELRHAALRRGAIGVWEKSMPIRELVSRLRAL